MSATVLNKVYYRVKDQGIGMLLCVILIKFGVALQRFGFRAERFLQSKNGRAARHSIRRFPGILDLIGKSYMSSPSADVQNHYKIKADNVITWIVPNFSKGSGGHTTIFRFIAGLEKLGVKNRIFLLNDVEMILDAVVVKKEICEFFSPIVADVEIISPADMDRSVDTLICTSWQTAYAARVINAHRKIYFMQDYEPFFNPVGSYYFFAEETYRMGFEYFTAGPWLLETVKEKYLGKGDFFYLCPDRSIYYPRKTFSLPEFVGGAIDPSSKLFSIGLYNRAHTPRRCVELVWVALDILAQRGHSIYVYTFGEDEKRSLPFPNKPLGILNHSQLAEVYSYCDVIIAPSATNLSLLAREVMACGGVVIDLLGENTKDELFDGENAILCKPNVENFVSRLEALIVSPKEVSELKEKITQNIISLPDWNEQFSKMREFLNYPRSV